MVKILEKLLNTLAELQSVLGEEKQAALSLDYKKLNILEQRKSQIQLEISVIEAKRVEVLESMGLSSNANIADLLPYVGNSNIEAYMGLKDELKAQLKKVNSTANELEGILKCSIAWIDGLSSTYASASNGSHERYTANGLVEISPKETLLSGKV